MNRITDLAKKYRFYIILLALSAFSLIYMICYSGIKSLWYDDIYQIYFTWEKTFFEAIEHIKSVDLNPPLWSIFTFFWQKIVPFGTTWLKLPSIIAVSISIILVGLCAKKIFGEKVGLTASILSTLHAGVVIICGFSYRSYGALFLFSSLLIYTFSRRYFAPTLFNRVLFLLSVFLIGFTHYFGALLCVFLAICDFILCLKGKQKKTFIVEYAIVGICELPWLLSQLSNITETFGDFWTSKPTVFEIAKLLKLFTLDSYILLVIFIILAVITVIELIRYFKNKYINENINSFIFRIIFLTVPSLFVFTIFLYSQLSSGASLWVHRYFYLLIPLVIIFISASLIKLFDVISQRYLRSQQKGLVASICLFAVLLGILVPKYLITIHEDTYVEYEPFEQAAEIVMAQPEITSGEQVLVFNTTKCAGGWDYYLGQKNSRDMSNVTLVGLHEYTNDLASSYDTIIIYAVHFDGTFDIDEIIRNLLKTHSFEHVDAHYSIYKFTKNVK